MDKKMALANLISMKTEIEFESSDTDEMKRIKCDSLNEAIASLKKDVAQKPELVPDKYCDLLEHYYCPSCGYYFGQAGKHESILFKKYRFCQGENCGQAMDWEK